jgi:hypothetical protein
LKGSTLSEPEKTETENPELNLLMPPGWNRPLWRRLFDDVRDRVFPEKLAPLQLTSRPINVGMMVGDVLSLPWYRTVFTNLGNVITPETLPPLELESRPVEVGELLSDQLSQKWWQSLLRSLADRVAPERLPALELTAKPAEIAPPGAVQIVPWSSLISLPRVPFAERRTVLASPVRVLPVGVAPSAQSSEAGTASTAIPDAAFVHAHHGRLQSALSRSRLRQALLISVAAAEATYLVLSALGLV